MMIEVKKKTVYVFNGKEYDDLRSAELEEEYQTNKENNTKEKYKNILTLVKEKLKNSYFKEYKTSFNKGAIFVNGESSFNFNNEQHVVEFVIYFKLSKFSLLNSDHYQNDSLSNIVYCNVKNYEDSIIMDMIADAMSIDDSYFSEWLKRLELIIGKDHREMIEYFKDIFENIDVENCDYEILNKEIDNICSELNIQEEDF